MKRRIRVTFFARNILVAFASLLLIGLVITFAGVRIQRTLALENLYQQSFGVAGMAAHSLPVSDIETVRNNPVPGNPAAKTLAVKLDEVSKVNSNVAQVYLFGAELQEGKSLVLAVPSHLAAQGLATGDHSGLAPQIREAISQAAETKAPAKTHTYKDEFGTWISITQPVMDNHGNVLAVMGMDVSADILEDNIHKVWMYSLAVLLGALIVIMGAQYLMTKWALAPVKDLFHAIEVVSAGDLNIRLGTQRHDDFGELNRKFEAMIADLRGVISGVQHKAELAAVSSQDLSETVNRNIEAHQAIAAVLQSVTEGAVVQEQAASESSRVMEEMSKGVQNIAETAYHVSESAAEMDREAEHGAAAVRGIVTQMSIISDSVNLSSGKVQALEQSSMRISEFVGIITGLASQTHLLALNAAIEAAHAGEMGRGFAVVAAEVRKLAEQSGQAANHIAGIVEQIHAETGETVLLMNSGMHEVEAGMELSRRTDEAFSRIAELIRSVSAETADMSSVTEQMSASSEEVSASVAELSAIAKETADSANSLSVSAADEVSSLAVISGAADRLKAMSRELEELILKFKA